MDYMNPHSCQHCESLILSRPEDDPDLHEGSEPRRSLLLLRALRALRDESAILRRLEQTFLHEIDPEDLVRFVSDGCLFYKFISNGLEELHKKRKHYEMIPVAERGGLEQINSGANRRQARHLICVELKDDAVEISTPYDPNNGDTNLEIKPRLLHNCVFGVFAEGG
jgi:hypothetical protein